MPEMAQVYIPKKFKWLTRNTGNRSTATKIQHKNAGGPSAVYPARSCISSVRSIIFYL